MFQTEAKMTSIVADFVHGYRDLMDNKSGKMISFNFFFFKSAKIRQWVRQKLARFTFPRSALSKSVTWARMYVFKIKDDERR